MRQQHSLLLENRKSTVFE